MLQSECRRSGKARLRKWPRQEKVRKFSGTVCNEVGQAKSGAKRNQVIVISFWTNLAQMRVRGQSRRCDEMNPSLKSETMFLPTKRFAGYWKIGLSHQS